MRLAHNPLRRSERPRAHPGRDDDAHRAPRRAAPADHPGEPGSHRRDDRHPRLLRSGARLPAPAVRTAVPQRRLVLPPHVRGRCAVAHHHRPGRGLEHPYSHRHVRRAAHRPARDHVADLALRRPRPEVQRETLCHPVHRVVRRAVPARLRARLPHPGEGPPVPHLLGRRRRREPSSRSASTSASSP